MNSQRLGRIGYQLGWIAVFRLWFLFCVCLDECLLHRCYLTCILWVCSAATNEGFYTRRSLSSYLDVILQWAAPGHPDIVWDSLAGTLRRSLTGTSCQGLSGRLLQFAFSWSNPGPVKPKRARFSLSAGRQPIQTQILIRQDRDSLSGVFVCSKPNDRFVAHCFSHTEECYSWFRTMHKTWWSAHPNATQCQTWLRERDGGINKNTYREGVERYCWKDKWIGWT